MNLPRLLPLLCLTCALGLHAEAPAFNDPQPQRYELTARASELDKRVQAHPEIEFLIENKGKPADVQQASVDTRVAPQGKLMIWLMGHSPGLFERMNSYGIHALRVHYANGWFGKYGKMSPNEDPQILGKIRLEAATGEDFSELVSIPKPDGMMERAYQFVKWLSKQHPQGKWEQFLSKDGQGLDWEKVIISGSSHGSTTAARFAKHQKVGRVVMLCGPRDQYDTWQSLPSATPQERYFGFSHVLDGGWSGDHYCRSWELLGLHQFGPIVNVDHAKPPYGNTRRLISEADVGGDDKRAHSSVTPGKASPKNDKGELQYEPVWRYLYMHPVEQKGDPVSPDDNCSKDLREAAKK